MSCRTSQVEFLSVIEVDTSSVLEIGDSQNVTPTANVLAVQRENAIFFENEFSFRDYSLFFKDIPRPSIEECIHIATCQESPLILVKNVRIDFVAAASVIHIGSSECLTSETRVKNIRHLMREKT